MKNFVFQDVLIKISIRDTGIMDWKSIFVWKTFQKLDLALYVTILLTPLQTR